MSQNKCSSLKHFFIAAFLLLAFISLIIATNFAFAEVNVEEREQILTDRLITIRGYSDFNGLCGKCTAYQLGRAGIFSYGTTEGEYGYNGNQCYAIYKNLTPINGMTVTTFPASQYSIRQIINLLNDSNKAGQNTYAMFCFNKGSYTDAGQAYGHVLLVHAVYNGKVYWGESYDWTCRVFTIDEFVNTYSEYYKDGKRCQVFDGAIVYNYNTASASTLSFKDVEYPEKYYINNSGWNLGGGVLASDVDLVSIRSEIINNEGKCDPIDSGDITTIYGDCLAIKLINSRASFSSIIIPGEYTWRLTGNDIAGRTLTLEIPFEARTDISRTEISSKTASKVYDEATNILVSGITLNKTTLNLNPNSTFVLTATVSPDNATHKSVNWTSSDNSVVTVSDNGLVTAIAPGTATITATAVDSSEKTTVCSVKVYKPTSSGAIYVYNQWDTKYKSKALSGGNNMHTSGCGIFSMAHAYQWLSKDSLNQSQADSLLDTLIGVYSTPWVGDLSQYYNYMIDNSVMLKHEGKYTSESQYQSLFNNGGCVLLHPQGHYSLAVGMTHRDLNNDGIEETYVHVIDSVISATLGRWNDAGTYWTSHGYSAYYISSFSKMNPNTSNCGHGKEFGRGGEYWLDYQSFYSIAQRCLWPAEQIQPADTLEFRNVQYPDPFKINTTQGWYLGSGTVVSNANLTSIRSVLSNADASWSQDTGEISISGHSFAIATRSFDQQVKFSDLTTEGNYTWTLIAKDDQNRVLSMTIPFYVSATQSTNSDHAVSKAYIKLIESIDSTFEEGELIHLGEIGTVYPRIYPENATNQSLIWVSSNQAVLTIDNAGNYETLSAGETEITCYSTDGSDVQSQTVRVRVGHPCEWVLSIEPSALHDGLNENKCAVCGFVADSEVIPSFAGKCYNDPDFITPSGLSAIDDEAFSGIGVQYIKLSDRVASIGKNAFVNCVHLKQIFIPSSVTLIGENAIPNTGNIDIVGFKNTEAESYALNHSIHFIALDDDVFEWIPIESLPENSIIVNTKTQYSFREQKAGSYTEWSAWSAWSEFTQQITDSNLKEMESKTQYRWWAAKCSNCGQNNPYHATNCKNCGTYLDSNQEGSIWISVFAYSDDTSGTQTILGRSQGRYFNGAPYWNTNTQPTVYRYRTRELAYEWSAWSDWSDTPVVTSETREVNTRTMVQYRIN